MQGADLAADEQRIAQELIDPAPVRLRNRRHRLVRQRFEAVTHWSLTSLREKLVKIGAKIVTHARYVISQMAEVAVPRDLFQEILRLIDGLRLRPAAA